MDLQQFIEQLDIARIFRVVFFVLLGLWVLRRITRFLDQLGEKFATWRMASKRVAAVFQFLTYFVLFAVIMSTLVSTQNKEALYAALGALGLAVGFAFKDLLASVVAGIVLLIDEPFRVGDWVEFEDDRGEIEKIGLRSVKMVKYDASVVTIPNAKFLTEAARSMTHGEVYAMLVIPFYIDPSSDVVLARQIIAEAAWTSRFAYTPKPVVTLVNDQFVDHVFVTRIRAKAWVYDHRIDGKFITDVTERVKVAFARHGIQAPGAVATSAS